MRKAKPQRQDKPKIITLRNKKVILSQDLAEFYGVEMKVLHQAVKRNLERFPGDFMFQLDPEEVKALRSPMPTSEPGRDRNSEYPTYAFTEDGVAMLSGVLPSPEAIRVNIEMVWAFARLRQILATHKDFARQLEELETKVNVSEHQLQPVLDAIRKMMVHPNRPKRWIVYLEESAAVYRVG